MKKKPNDADIAGLMAKIQAQLAVLKKIGTDVIIDEMKRGHTYLIFEIAS